MTHRSPPAVHSANARLALRNGCHILSEKPIALSINEAKILIDLAKEHQRIFMINQNYRWHPSVQSLKSYLQNKPLGDIEFIDISYAQSFNFNDTFRYTIDHPFLTDMGVHHFDLVRYITCSNFKKVYCIEHNSNRSPFKCGGRVSAVFEMDGGIPFSYQGSWTDIATDGTFIGSWKIGCEKGTIFWDGDRKARIDTKEGAKIATKTIELVAQLGQTQYDIFLHGLRISLDNFFTAIETSTEPETAALSNINTLDMVISSALSAEQNRVIQSQLVSD